MEKKQLLAFILLFTTSFSKAGLFQESKVSEKDRPNIIFILTDDQRYDALGYAGNSLISTPEMDELAQLGTYFPNAMVTTPICAASRATILTGLHERTHGFNFSTTKINPKYMETAYPNVLRENGYFTGFYGKYGVFHKDLEEQFDVYESYDRNGEFPDKRGYFYKTIGKDTVHLTRYTGQKALDFISNSDVDKPFCLSLSFSAPHAHDNAVDQYFWQKGSDELLKDTSIPGPELAEETFFLDQPKSVQEGFNRLRWTWRYDTPEKYQHSLKGYYRMIFGIDREIGKIRKQLKDKGIEKNTIIIIMGDNGYFLGERQLAGKWLLYDKSVRVPLIIYDPRNAITADSDVLALNVDIPSTLLDFAAIPQPKHWQGKSLVPFVKGEVDIYPRDTVLLEHLWEFEHIPPSEGVRTASWKYFRYINDKSIEELYNLTKDSQETQNLAKDPLFASKIAKFRKTTDRLASAYNDDYSLSPDNLTASINIYDNGTHSYLYSWHKPPKIHLQIAYQILVATSEEYLNNNIGNIWNSGRIALQGNSNIIHQGENLKEGKDYFWKVRVWDQDNRLSQYSKTMLLE